MRRFARALLVAGLLVGALTLSTNTAEAGIFRRGWGPFGGWGGYRVYRPAWGNGYRAYRPYGPGYGWRGYGFGYPGYGYGYGYSGYYGMGYPGSFGGTTVSIGGPYGGGLYIGSYPW
jgi:hypothetical protein